VLFPDISAYNHLKSYPPQTPPVHHCGRPGPPVADATAPGAPVEATTETGPGEVVIGDATRALLGGKPVVQMVGNRNHDANENLDVDTGSGDAKSERPGNRVIWLHLDGSSMVCNHSDVVTHAIVNEFVDNRTLGLLAGAESAPSLWGIVQLSAFLRNAGQSLVLGFDRTVAHHRVGEDVIF
jgi:hypothetical protein